MLRRRAFTLVELLTVIAITGILLTLVAIPLINSFNLTRTAQGFADAQDKARSLIDRITREASNAAGVRDNTGDKGAVDIIVPGLDGSPVTQRLFNTKLDLLMPSAGEPLRGPNGALLNPKLLIDPNGDPNDPANWKEDPTLRTPSGQMVLPATTGFKLVRYWIGLRSPIARDNGGNDIPGVYNNPFSDILVRGSGVDNLYVLYRAEVDYKRWNPATSRWVFNNELFVDADNDGNPDNIDDPAFFLAQAGNSAAAQRRNAEIRAWLRRAIIVTEFSRYDMIQPIFDKRTFRAVYDGNVPRILPLIQFRPTRVANEPAENMQAVRTNQEFVNADKMGSDLFKTAHGAWANATVRLWPSVWNAAEPDKVFELWQSGTPYEVGRTRFASGVPAGMSVFDFSTGNESVDGVETFDISAYLAAKSADPALGAPPGYPLFPFPFTFAVDEANKRSNWLSNAAVRERFVPFTMERAAGQVVASFAITEVGGANSRTVAAGQDNRPYAFVGDPIIPGQLTGTGPNDWQQAQYSPSSPDSTINGRFNVLFNHWTTLFGGNLARTYCKRFVDLRFMPCADGTASPLHPTLGFPRTRIVPGSEVVIGPDQNEGPNKGKPVRYTRVSIPSEGSATVGPNQYYLNYVNRQDAQALYNDLGLGPVSTDPTVYDPANLAQAILQPRFRVGYLELYSEPNDPIPAGNISVFYRFQMTESSDVVAIDYDTREVIDVSLTIRNYPQTTLPTTQSVTLRGSATVRNYLR